MNYNPPNYIIQSKKDRKVIEKLMPVPSVEILHQHIDLYDQPGVAVHLMLRVGVQFNGPGYTRIMMSDQGAILYGRINENISQNLTNTVQEIHGKVMTTVDFCGSKFWIDVLSFREVQDKSWIQLLNIEYEFSTLYKNSQPKY